MVFVYITKSVFYRNSLRMKKLFINTAYMCLQINLFRIKRRDHI